MADANSLIPLGRTPEMVQNWFFATACGKRKRYYQDDAFFVAETAASVPRLLNRGCHSNVAVLVSRTVLRRTWAEEPMREAIFTHMLDTSGAYIKDVGTPTLLLLRLDCQQTPGSARFALGNRGEPETPRTPEEGLVWRSLTAHYDEAGYRDEWIEVSEWPLANWMERMRAHNIERSVANLRRARGPGWKPTAEELADYRRSIGGR